MTHQVPISSIQTFGRLTGRVARPRELGSEQRRRMGDLLYQFFENVNYTQFEQDLFEKEWVFLFSDESGTIQGFSTLMRLQLQIDNRPVVAVYSGDTIIHPDYWHEMELPKIWGKHVFDLADEVHVQTPEAQIYWFLISSGYKTYRFLPVFFQEFYPSYRQSTPAHIKRIVDALATHKFGNQYDATTGIVRFRESSPLRDGIAKMDERRLRNPDIAFFVQTNPGHEQGEQLACLVEIDQRNLTPAGRRMLGLD